MKPKAEDCGKSKVYKAIRAPTCNGGNPCKACRLKWEVRNALVLEGDQGRYGPGT